jgi:hypothetical protein
MADPLATLATYWSLEDCAVHRTALDAAAIENFADDYFVVNIDWLYANVMRGIKLRVPREDLESAAEVLEGATDVGEPEPFEEPVERCDVCGWTDFQSTRKWLVFAGAGVVFIGAAIAVDQTIFAFLVMIAAFLIALMAPSYRCTECGERW